LKKEEKENEKKLYHKGNKGYTRAKYGVRSKGEKQAKHKKQKRRWLF